MTITATPAVVSRRPGRGETPTAPPMGRSAPTRAVEGSAAPLAGPASAEACQDGPCRNGGTCRPRRSPSGAASFRCDCPLRFAGPLCDQGNPPPSPIPLPHSQNTHWIKTGHVAALRFIKIHGGGKLGLTTVMVHASSPPAIYPTHLPLEGLEGWFYGTFFNCSFPESCLCANAVCGHLPRTTATGVL